MLVGKLIREKNMTQTPQFRIIADDFRIKIKDTEDILIDYDSNGVAFVEEYIIKIPKNVGVTNNNSLIFSIACFVGESVICNYGGKWKYFHEYDQWGITFGGATAFYPISHVCQQFEDKKNNNIHLAFMALKLNKLK